MQWTCDSWHTVQTFSHELVTVIAYVIQSGFPLAQSASVFFPIDVSYARYVKVFPHTLIE